MLAVVQRNLSVLLSAIENELYNTNSPSASPVTIFRIIHIRVRVPHVAVATT